MQVCWYIRMEKANCVWIIRRSSKIFKFCIWIWTNKMMKKCKKLLSLNIKLYAKI